jgi:hypothetical protein
MKRFSQCLHVTAAGFLALVLSATPAAAQQARTVGGLVVNFGMVSAAAAMGAAGHSESHPASPPSGSQHLLVTLDDEKTRKRIGEAEVAVEVTDPQGRVEKKPLLHTQAGGMPDYSELFVFGWPGKYSIRVIITPKPGVKPVETVFVVTHSP